MKNKIQWREPAGETVSAIFAGDFSPREVNADDVAARAEEIVSEVKTVFENCDLRILQLEFTVTDKDTPIPKSGPNHRAHAGCLKLPQALGIDTVLLANNHTGDYGDEGLLDTLKYCKEAGFQSVGAGENAAAAAAPLMMERNGLRIALLNQAEHEFGIAGEHTPGCAGLDPMQLTEKIKSLKKDCDLVWVALHGGHEHYPFPSPRLHQMCRFLADNGADLVFNCHSHCPCGYEIYNGTPIIYSPGNFYFPARPTSLPGWFIGYLPKFYCDRQGSYALELIPYYNHKDKIRLLDDQDAEAFFHHMETLNKPLQDRSKLNELFDSWSSLYGAEGYMVTLLDLPKPEPGKLKAEDQNWLGVKNIFCCEAHNELLRHTLLMMEQGKLEEAKSRFPEISVLQRPDWVKKG